MLNQAFESMGIPIWVIPALIIGFIYLMVHLLNPKTAATKARRLVASACMTAGEERQAMEQEALDMVKDDPEGLMSVAQEAMQRGRHALARECMDQLEATGKRSLDVRKMRELLDGSGDGQLARELVAIRGLLEEGLMRQARQRWQRAIVRWPDSDALKGMGQRLESAEPEDDATEEPSEG